VDAEIKRLRWKCRRGMKELDTVLLKYLEDLYPVANSAHRQAFASILDMPDPELWALLMGKSFSKNREIGDVVNALKCPTQT